MNSDCFRKVEGLFMARQKFMGGTTARLYPPQHRSELLKKLGAATKVHLVTRVYDRAGAGAPSIDFEVYAGCFGDEPPQLGLRAFSITPAGVLPVALPWTAIAGFTPPDDGYFTLTPTMGLLDVLLKISGSATTWVELEIWYTAEYGS
jgi:hypothetical protein